jgi:hypothetical protein
VEKKVADALEVAAKEAEEGKAQEEDEKDFLIRINPNQRKMRRTS